MRMLHGSIAHRAIVQLQQSGHVTPNSATERLDTFLIRGLSIMATFVNASNLPTNGLLDRLLALRPSLAKAVRLRRVYTQTVYELNQLSDRELADLGISRLSIREVAYEAAYGN
jgi:uncharacterized protein YjiS (DUF1127 family)